MGHGAYNPGEYGSFRMAPIGRAHRWTGTLLGASMWFFMMYRAKQDGAALLGLSHPWEHGHHGDDDSSSSSEKHH